MSSEQALVELAKHCIDIVSTYGCASANLILEKLSKKLGKNRKSVLRSDIVLVLRALVLARVLEERQVLGVHFFCMPNYKGTPPELEDILRTLYDIVAASESPLVGITVRGVLRRLRQREDRRVKEPPSSQQVTTVINHLYSKIGVDKLVRKRGIVYLFTRSELQSLLTRYLDGHVEEKQVKPFVTRELSKLAALFTKIFRK